MMLVWKTPHCGGIVLRMAFSWDEWVAAFGGAGVTIAILSLQGFLLSSWQSLGQDCAFAN